MNSNSLLKFYKYLLIRVVLFHHFIIRVTVRATMKVENDEKFNRTTIKAEGDNFPIAYVPPNLNSERKDVNCATIPTTTVITEEEFFNLHGYIFETDLKIEATRLQDHNGAPRVEQQVDEQPFENGSDNIEILCPKKIMVKVKRLSNRTIAEVLCPKKVVLRLKKLAPEVMTKYSTKFSCPKLRRSEKVEKKFTCDICCKKYTNKTNLKGHIFKVHHTQLPYRCYVCPKGYRSKVTLRNHERIHRPRKCPFSCTICSKAYSHEGALKQHLQEHLGETSGNVKKRRCQFCQMKFFTTQELVVHRTTHTDLRFYQCEICPMNFTTKGALQQHQRNHMTNSYIERPFECYLCKKEFALVHCLRNHMRIHATKYDCRICMEIFDQEVELDEHMLKHSGKYRFECNECSKGFMWRTSLTRHVRIHTSERPFQCEYCRKTFKEKDYLLAHRRTHVGKNETAVDRSKFTWKYVNEVKFRQSKTYNSGSSGGSDSKGQRIGKEFKCKICLTILKNKNELNSHFDEHTGKYLFECLLCKKGFDYGPNLYRHLRQHAGAKPYQCDRCPRRFKDTSSLKAHIRCHNGEKVECDVCLKKFTEKGYLKIHKRLHTGEHPFECTQCKTKYIAKQALKLHTCFKCEICSQHFSIKYLLRRHMLTHLKKGKNVCTTKRA